VPTEAELGWAAGILDGEGGVYVTRTNKNSGFNVKLTVGNTSLALLERFMRIVGGVGSIRRRPRVANTRKHIFIYDVNAGRAVHVARLLRPYASLKSPQCDLIIQAHSLVGPRGTTRNPNKSKLDKLYRQCRALNRVGPRVEDDFIALSFDPQLSFLEPETRL